MAGNPDFAQSVTRYIDMVYRIAVNGMKNPADAEDVTQTVMLKLCRKGGGFTNEDHLKYWLIRVTVNECKRSLSSAWHNRVVQMDELPEQPVFETPEESNLYTAVMALKPKYRIVIYLYYYEDCPIVQIADTLGVSETAVQTRLMRARKMLREKLAGG